MPHATEPALTHGERLALDWLPADGTPRAWRRGGRGQPALGAFLALEERGLAARMRSSCPAVTGPGLSNCMARWLTPAGVALALQLRDEDQRDAQRWRTIRHAGVALQQKKPGQPWTVAWYYDAEADDLADFLGMCDAC